MDYQHLKGNQLLQRLQAMEAILENQDPSQIDVSGEIPNNDTRAYVTDMSNMFDKGQSFDAGNKNQLNEDEPQNPRDRIIDALKKPKTDRSKKNSSQITLLLASFGFEDTAENAADLAARLDNNTPLIEISNNIHTEQTAQIKAELQAAADKVEQEQQASFINARQDFGTTSLGFENPHDLVSQYKWSLKTEDAKKAIGVPEDVPQNEVASYIYNNKMPEAVSYLIKTGEVDFSEQLADAVSKGDIKTVDNILGADGSEVNDIGILTADKIDSIKDYFNAAGQKGLGEVGANFTMTGEISASNIRHALSAGTIPVITDALPERFSNISDPPSERDIRKLGAYLADKGNFKEYNAALKEHRQELSADFVAVLEGVKPDSVKITAAPNDASSFDETIAVNNPIGIEAGSKLAENSDGTTIRDTAVFSDTEKAYQALAEGIILQAGEDGKISLQDAVRVAHYGGTAESNWTHLGWGASEASNLDTLARGLSRKDTNLPKEFNVNDPAQLKQALGATTVISNWNSYQPTWKTNGQNTMVAFGEKTPQLAVAADAVAKRLTGTAAPEEELDNKTPDTKQDKTPSTPAQDGGALVSQFKGNANPTVQKIMQDARIAATVEGMKQKALDGSANSAPSFTNS